MIASKKAKSMIRKWQVWPEICVFDTDYAPQRGCFPVPPGGDSRECAGMGAQQGGFEKLWIDSIRWSMHPAGRGPGCLGAVNAEPVSGVRGAGVRRGISHGSGVYAWCHRWASFNFKFPGNSWQVMGRHVAVLSLSKEMSTARYTKKLPRANGPRSSSGECTSLTLALSEDETLWRWHDHKRFP